MTGPQEDGDRPAVPGLEPPDGRTRPLDTAKDPDRFRPPGQGQSLTDLLGEGAHVDGRDGYQWVAGLLGVLGFLALVAFLFQNVVTP
jgi:hypothetical protein